MIFILTKQSILSPLLSPSRQNCLLPPADRTTLPEQREHDAAKLRAAT
jgi:hypothetical protein